MDKGDVDGKTGTGKKLGDMIGVFVDTNGKIYGSYDNGNTILLGQIAVAQFANQQSLGGDRRQPGRAAHAGLYR